MIETDGESYRVEPDNDSHETAEFVTLEAALVLTWREGGRVVRDSDGAVLTNGRWLKPDARQPAR